MITLTQAVTLVEQEINASTIYEDEAKKVVLSDSTVEKKWGVGNILSIRCLFGEQESK